MLGNKVPLNVAIHIIKLVVMDIHISLVYMQNLILQLIVNKAFSKNVICGKDSAV